MDGGVSFSARSRWGNPRAGRGNLFRVIDFAKLSLYNQTV